MFYIYYVAVCDSLTIQLPSHDTRVERVCSYFVKERFVTVHCCSSVDATTFTDILKVEGAKGVYIASQVQEIVGSNPGPEHLRSVITWDWGGEWKPLAAPNYSAEFHPLNCELVSL